MFSIETTDVRCALVIYGMMDGWIEEWEDGRRNGQTDRNIDQ